MRYFPWLQKARDGVVSRLSGAVAPLTDLFPLGRIDGKGYLATLAEILSTPIGTSEDRTVRAVRVIEAQGAPAAINTAGAVTLTAAQIIGGSIVADCAGASRAYTLPTAALLVAAVAALKGAANVGDIIKCYLVNGSDGAEVITIGEGAGGSFIATHIAAQRTINQHHSKMLHFRLTNVTAAAEAYDVWF